MISTYIIPDSSVRNRGVRGTGSAICGGACPIAPRTGTGANSTVKIRGVSPQAEGPSQQQIGE
ncbi:MAG TPA: hypothetical protein VJU54_06430 [Nitrospiraceae bacterium]|nr:hypothetical protein [Nitrospiraceae bacterium]